MNWIKVDDRLPEFDIDVFCCLHDNTNTLFDQVFVGYLNSNDNNWYDNMNVIKMEDNRYVVSHWAKIIYPTNI